MSTPRWLVLCSLLLLASCSNGPATPDTGTATPTPFPQTPVTGGSDTRPPPVGGSLRIQSEPVHTQRQAVEPSIRTPHTSDRSIFRRDYNHGTELSSQALAGCNTSAFTSTGDSLVQQIVNSTPECINELFSLSASQGARTFSEGQMVSAANGMKTRALSYAGSNNGIEQLLLFLRAGYYVQYYNPTVIGSYGAPLKTAIRSALDAFANNASFTANSDAHGQILSEYMTLIDSSSENAYGLPIVKRVLRQFDPAIHTSRGMKAGTNAAFTVLFRGHYVPEFQTAVKQDPSITKELTAFANKHFSLLGGSDDYLVANAGREAARFLQYTELRPVLRPELTALLNRSSMTGPTAKLWVGIAEMVDYYDDCTPYGLCGFKTRLAQTVLGTTYNCSPTLTLKAQSMTSAQIQATCTSVINEETYFHTKLATNRQPVANDFNDKLELVVFNSSSDYETYAGVLYGIDTNNGGMYLEGDPSVQGNQARFIAYRADWQPTFEIWNLNHEYAHYLDGRFNMAGDFTDSISEKTVWWIEGTAEYIAYSYRGLPYTAALNEAAKATYALSTIFQNDYNSGQTRVYNWGYLAARFMFERHPNEVKTILSRMRAKDYAGYASFMRTSIGSAYDGEFRDWALNLKNNPNPNPDPTPTPGLGPCTSTENITECQRANVSGPAGDYRYFYALVPSGAKTLDIRVSGGTGDAHLYYSPSSWATQGNSTQRSTTAGNEERLVIQNPAPGYHYFSLYGQSAFSGVSVSSTTSGATTPTEPTPGVTECPTTDANLLGKNCKRSGLSSTYDFKYFYVDIPAGTPSVTVTLSGGTGNADLYYNRSSWATSSTYTQKSTGSANSETITINQPAAGLHYFTIGATAPYSNVTIQTNW